MRTLRLVLDWALAALALAIFLLWLALVFIQD
jgi:hypothetical protein